MRWFSNLLILMTILFAASFSEAKVSKQVLSKKQSVVTIYIEDDKKTIAFGSGFIIDANGLIVTNHHVIAPWEKSKTGKLFIKKSDKKFLTPVEIVATDEDKDVAIIKVKETGLPAIKLATKYKPTQGESVVVIGSPLGFETTVTDGIVSGIRGEDGFVQITAPIAQGSSGSPVLNENGDAIGVATLLIKDAQNLNFAIPVSYVENILSKPAMEKSAKSNTDYVSLGTVFAAPTADLLTMMSSKSTWSEFNWDNFTQSKLSTSFSWVRKESDKNMGDRIIDLGVNGLKATAILRENTEKEVLRLARLEFKEISEADGTRMLDWCVQKFGSDYTESNVFIPLFMEGVAMGFYTYQWVIDNTVIFYTYSGMVGKADGGSFEGRIAFRDVRKAEIIKPDIKLECKYAIDLGNQSVDVHEFFVIESWKRNLVKDEKLYSKVNTTAKLDDTAISLTLDSKEKQQELNISRLTGGVTGRAWLKNDPATKYWITGECSKFDKLIPRF